jgi:hypothetical protein
LPDPSGKERISVKALRILTALSTTLLLGLPAAHAYLTIGESTEVPKAADYQVGFEPQILTDGGGGSNFTAYFDSPFNDATTGRLWLGAGKIDFNVGATVKYVPFPDVDTQPGIGFRAGGFFARKSDLNILTLQLAPIFSKKWNTDAGLFIPYVAVALDLTNTKDRNYTGSQFVIGTEYKTTEIPNMYFGTEVGFNLQDSYSYISGNITFPFDSSKGLF